MPRGSGRKKANPLVDRCIGEVMGSKQTSYRNSKIWMCRHGGDQSAGQDDIQYDASPSPHPSISVTYTGKAEK